MIEQWIVPVVIWCCIHHTLSYTQHIPQCAHFLSFVQFFPFLIYTSGFSTLRADAPSFIALDVAAMCALFPSETLQMCPVLHEGFEMLEIWLESLLKGQNTYVQHVQSKSVIKAT